MASERVPSSDVLPDTGRVGSDAAPVKMTEAEARRIVALTDCRHFGHNWDVQQTLAGPPQLVVCTRCGTSHAISPATGASVAAVLAIDPADHATESRDYGRGFADCLRRVRELLGASS